MKGRSEKNRIKRFMNILIKIWLWLSTCAMVFLVYVGWYIGIWSVSVIAFVAMVLCHVLYRVLIKLDKEPVPEFIIEGESGTY
jgi:Ni,Fe-hydrogenase I cytochrome b subunit